MCCLLRRTHSSLAHYPLPWSKTSHRTLYFTTSQTRSLPPPLDELGWLPLFECRKHSRLTVIYKALNNLSAFSLDHLSVSSRHTRASNEKKFYVIASSYWCFKYSFFSSDHYQLEFPPTSCSSLAVDSVLPRGSAELGILQPLLIIVTLLW